MLCLDLKTSTNLYKNMFLPH